MKMNKIVVMLKYYDQNKFLEYCCLEHCRIFQTNEFSIVMNPPMSIKINDLLSKFNCNIKDIIQLVIDNLDESKFESLHTFVNLLTLDISPCLQKSIVIILINYFKNPKLNTILKRNSLNNLLKVEFLDILLYNFSISLIDVRCELIKLLKEITNPTFKDLISINLIEEKVIPILKEYILPNNLYVVVKNFSKVEASPNKTNSSINLSSNHINHQKSNFSSSLLPVDNNLICLNNDNVSDDKQIINFNFLDQVESKQEVIKEINYTSSINIDESENLNKNDISDLKPNSMVKSQSDLSGRSGEEADIIKPLKLKKAITGYAGRNNKLSSISPDKERKINLNMDDINRLYKFGGEKGEKNITEEESFKELETKVKTLAKHCVDFILEEGNKSCIDDNNLANEIDETKPDGGSIIKKQQQFLQPRSVRGNQKINYKNFDMNLDNDIIVEEEMTSEIYSPLIQSKRSKNSKVSNTDPQFFNFKLNIVTDDLKSPVKALKTEEKSPDGSCINLNLLKFQTNDTKKKSLNQQTINHSDHNYENLDNYYDREIYQTYINSLYYNLFEWMLNKKDSINSDGNFNEYQESIVNEYIIEIYVKLCNMNNLSLTKKFLLDIHLLMANNRENSIIFYKNTSFYYWLVETTFQSYKKLQVSTDDNDALAIYDLGKKIHTEMIFNIAKEDKFKSEPMIKISNLLSWGIFYKNLISNPKPNYDVNDFIKFLLKDLLSCLIDKSKFITPNLNASIWENLVVLTHLCYEYMTFYNLEKILTQDPSTLKNWNYENIIVPRGLITGLNLDHVSKEPLSEYQLTTISSISEKKNIAAELWSDYRFYDTFYQVFSKFWEKSIFELNNEKSVTVKYDKIAKDFIIGRNQKDFYIEQLKLLFFSFKKENFSYNINLAKVISNMISITISLMQEEAEVKYWLEEYERFLKFLILASSNMLNKGELYSQVQETTIDIICFGLCFLIDQLNNTKKDSSLIKLYSDIIRDIVIIMIIIFKNISEEISKKKNKINKILGVLGKESKNTLYKLAVYRIFNEIIVDKSKAPILSKKVIDELIIKNFSEVPKLFKTEPWIGGLCENPFIKVRCKSLFDFNFYESVIKMRYDMMRTFKTFYSPCSNNEKNNEIQNIDKGNFIKTIEKTIPFYSKIYMDYQNIQYKLMRDKRLLYKCLKKNLFQWRGFWADKKLFYENYHKLKLKICNHYTSYYAKPILVNVLDIDYYLPVFTKFDRSQLFLDNESNLNYRIVLNIDEILDEEYDSIKSNHFAMLPQVTTKSNSNPTIGLAKNRKNYIFDIYNNSSVVVRKELEKISKMIIKPFGRYENNDTNEKLNSFKDKDLWFECCYVKQSHHIKGIFCFTKDGISFKPFSNQFSKKKNLKEEFGKMNNIEDDYDEDRNTCFGSVLTYHHKDKDISEYHWALNDIRFIFKRRYYYKKKAIEIFTYSNTSHFFTFKDQNKKDQVMKIFKSLFENKREIKLDQKDLDDKYVGIENLLNSKKINKSETLSAKVAEWANWKVSNFEMLMFFNLVSSRSYNNVTQYPVFPWIIKSYLDSKIKPRELSVPVGMIETDDENSKSRKKKFLEEYIESGFEHGKNRHYSTHYSTPFYIAYYLIRLFPVSQIHIELQGDKFDHANRLFFSVGKSFSCSTTQKGDVRELIPEFFYLPEMMLNINNLNLGRRINQTKGLVQVDNVQMPGWSNDEYDFIMKMKEFLENDEISYGISHWIDLIFGYKQVGKEAVTCGNVFEFNTYEDNINLETQEKSNRSILMRSVEFGITPSQILYKPMTQRINKDSVKRGKLITESTELKAYCNPNSCKTSKMKEKPVMIKMRVIESDRVICVFNNNTFNLTRYTPSDFKYNITVESKNYLTNDQEVKIHTRISHLYNENSINSPIVIYSNGKIFAQAGYYDGKISISYIEANSNKCFNYFIDPQNPILVLKVDKEEKYAFAGSKLGIVYMFKINEIEWTLHRTLFDHYSEITSIYISNTLNVLATSSLDGFLNLYTFPKGKLYRSIKSENNSPIDDVYLSAYPLPCVVIYSKNNKSLTTYSINGALLKIEEEDSKSLFSPVVFSDFNFNDYLIYGTSTGDVKIRKFPSMNLIQKITISDKSKNVADNRPIKCIDVTEDKKFIYLWQFDDIDITLVKDPSITSETSSVNLNNMGFGF